MRPRSITMFHRLLIAVMAISVVQTAISWTASQSVLEANPSTAMFGSWWFLLGVSVISYGIYALIWFKIVARASNAARWIFTVLTLLSLVSVPLNLTNAVTGLISPATAALMLASALAQLAAMVCLFLPDARRWFANRGAVADPVVFE
jgi:hypothetical protein